MLRVGALAKSPRTLGIRFFGFQNLIDPCNGWKFGDLFSPLKPNKKTEQIEHIPDMSISGLDMTSIGRAISNMSVPADVQKVTLGRWKPDGCTDMALSRKYT